jgi:hypothetical protein
MIDCSMMVFPAARRQVAQHGVAETEKSSFSQCGLSARRSSACRAL